MDIGSLPPAAFLTEVGAGHQLQCCRIDTGTITGCSWEVWHLEAEVWQLTTVIVATSSGAACGRADWGGQIASRRKALDEMIITTD